MDSHNRFDTTTTFALHRLEWLVALGVSITLALLHFGDIRWPVFVGLFVIIDLIGYVPGAIRFRRSASKCIGKGYYVLYNTMHSLVTGAAIAGLWALLVRPEWALLAIPIHLLGDRGLFGNTLKPFGVRFEPATHPAFTAFQAEYAKAATARPAPPDHGALQAIEYSGNPSAFLALNTGNEVFTQEGLRGAVVYREAGSHLVQFAGPLAPDPDYQVLLGQFEAFAARRHKRILAVQLQRADAEVYAKRGFTVNQIGASYAVDLKRFTLRGARFMKLRNKVSRAMRSGLSVEQVQPAHLREELDAIDAQWLRGKGRHTKELSFLVGERGGLGDEHRRLFLGRLNGEPIAYITYVPVHGDRSGWLHDLSRRRPDVPPGVMEAINVTAINTFIDEGARWLHFGFTPFTGLGAEHEVPSCSGAVRRVVGLLARHGGAVYPAVTQLAYKEKWGPHAVLPEYIAFQGRPSLGAIWRLMRVANAV